MKPGQEKPKRKKKLKITLHSPQITVPLTNKILLFVYKTEYQKKIIRLYFQNPHLKNVWADIVPSKDNSQCKGPGVQCA